MSDLFPPFEPERAESKRARFKPIPFRLLAPNVITLLALCLGLTAMRLVVEGKLETATICILIAAALDGVDGRLARMLKGTSRFGADLDSLSDFVNFGVATGYVLWIFVLHDLKSFGWIIVLTLACAMALRLARFNVLPSDHHHFVGLPIPLAAAAIVTPVLLADGHALRASWVPWQAALTTGIALLMVSRVPYRTFKDVDIRRHANWLLPLWMR